ncbi:MAG: hypothetical protein WC876_01910 [Candidatus Thermoplasmatota archaeon]
MTRYLQAPLNGYLLSKSNGVGVAGVVLLTGTSGSVFSARVYSADAGVASITAGTVTPGALTTVGLAYTYVADGTSRLDFYQNGLAAGSPITTAPGPVGPNSANGWMLGGTWNDSGARWGGDIRSAGCTATVMTPAQFAALDLAARGQLTDRDSAVIATTRTTSTVAEASDGTTSVLAPGVPEFSKGLLWSKGSATGLALQSRNLTATWAVSANVVCTRGTGKDGVPNSGSACVVDDTDAGTICQTLASVTTDAGRTTSLDLKLTDGGATAFYLSRDGGSEGWTALSASNCVNPSGAGTAPTAGSWVQCSRSTAQVGPVICLRAEPLTSFSVDYFDDVNGSFPRRIDTGATSVAENGPVYGPLGDTTNLSRTEGCAAVTVTPTWTGANTGAVITPVFVGNSALSARWLYVSAAGASATYMGCYDGTHFQSVSASYARGAAKRYRASWSASRNDFHCERLNANGTTAEAGVSSAFTTMPAYNTASSGSNSADVATVGLSGFVFDSNPDGCR